MSERPDLCLFNGSGVFQPLPESVLDTLDGNVVAKYQAVADAANDVYVVEQEYNATEQELFRVVEEKRELESQASEHKISAVALAKSVIASRRSTG